MALKNELGAIAWFSLMTTKFESIGSFYTQLFGWEVTKHEIPGIGDSIQYSATKGKVFAGPVPLEPNTDLSSHWIPYFAVRDVDQASRKVVDHGGTLAHEGFDIPTVGRTAIVVDPGGAPFHIYTPEVTDQDFNVIGGDFGEPCWLELTSNKPKALSSFYQNILPWGLSEIDMGTPDPYIIAKSGENMVCGISPRDPSLPTVAEVWLPYFMVQDIAQSSQQVVALGGKTHMDPKPIQQGIFALVEDPAGARFYLFQDHPK